VQLQLIDALVDAGASTDGAPENALVNGNADAARHLLTRGAALKLATALYLGLPEPVAETETGPDGNERQFALVLSALGGRAEGVARALALGADPSLPSKDLYSHATPLHHAVCSGSLDAVRMLVGAGADLAAKDRANEATPLGWARWYQREGRDPERRARYAAIESFLLASGAA
jgi:peptide-methionine (S)-S-oxide reductase